MDALAKAPADPAAVDVKAETAPAGSASIRAVPPGPVGHTPSWMLPLMPPGYQTRFAEIQRLSDEIQGMDRLGRLLYEIGTPLRDSVREMFVALRFDVDPIQPSSGRVVVRVDAKRRLLLHVAEAETTIEKKGPELAYVFQMLHEVAAEGDRVVLVANTYRGMTPTARPAAIAADALGLLSRMGANFAATPSLFNVWSQSLQDQNRARAHVERLHAQDGGTFAVTA